MKKIFFAIVVITTTLTRAQVVSTDPAFPVQDGTVTIIFDATQGNGALAGVAPPIFAHTGVVTNESATETSWLLVQGNWGTYDENVLMTEIGDDLYSITYNINDYYSVPAGDTVFRMGFVFRNTDGSIVGRNADGSDIFVEVYQPGLNVAILTPDIEPYIIDADEEVNISIASLDATVTELYIDDVLTASTATDLLEYTWSTSDAGLHTIIAVAGDGSDEVSDTTHIYVKGPVTIADLPAGAEPGINYVDDTTVTLVLYAPFKDYVFAIGDHSDWQVNDAVYMNRTPDGNTYWVTLTGLTPGEEYAYQYLVDGTLRVGDPLSEKVLDPWNDSFISSSNYPDLKPYPTGKTMGIVSVFQTAQAPYVWAYPDFTPPAKENLFVYELLVRDFLADRSYNSLIDSLEYLDRMGVTAIELMPIMEYEGNDSWGYNPSYFTALDKYYGTRETFKAFVDSCHARGIAVILDIAMNHAFGQSPLVQMWWDGSAPSAESPYFNQIPTHDYNVGYDFNHEAPATIDYRTRVFSYWLNEYNIDGYRFDLSKGFTQNNTLGDVGAWGAYDAGRIATWKSIADTLWAQHPDAILILEHFADNTEEKELANYGFMLWGNMNYNYNEATMGWGNGSGNSSLYWASWKNRGFDDPHNVVYAESHDEERLMYRNISFGNASNPDHNCKDLYTALARMEQVPVFLFGIPGPKMIWQFGELGYDYSIDYGCRVCAKPVKWNYLNESARYRLYQVYGAMGNLKKDYPTFATEDFNLSATGPLKRINLDNDEMNATILGNFEVNTNSIQPAFQHTGWWYEYFSGDSINVTDVFAEISMAPGAYRLYADVRLTTPEIIISVDDAAVLADNLAVYPNPSDGLFQFSWTTYSTTDVQIEIFDINGRMIWQQTGSYAAGYQQQTIDLSAQASGIYFARVSGEGFGEVMRLVRK